MKLIQIPFVLILLIFACKPDATQGEDNANSTPDSSASQSVSVQATPYPNDLTADSPEVQAIKAEVDSLNAKLKKVRTPTEMIPLNVESKHDQLGFWETDDNMGKITFRISGKEYEVNPSYIIKDGKLIYYHHREWQKTTDPHIREMYAYFDNGKLLFAEERYVEFDSGKGMPTLLMKTPFEKSTRSEAEIIDDLNSYWNWPPVADRAAKLLK